MWHWFLLRHFWCVVLLLAALPKFVSFSPGCACISSVLQSQFQVGFLSPFSPWVMLDLCTDRGKHGKWIKTCLVSKQNSLAGYKGRCGNEEGARQGSRAQIPCGITTTHRDTEQSERENNPSSSSLSKTFLSPAWIMQLKPLSDIQLNRVNTGLGSVLLQQEGKALQGAGSWVEL